MTISEAITQANMLKPNSYAQDIKLTWLSRIEAQIKKQIIDTHAYNDGETAVSFTQYDSSTDTGTALIAGEPYDELYVLWLEAQTDYANEEYQKFNNSNAMFSSAYSEFERYYNRTHMPKGEKHVYF